MNHIIRNATILTMNDRNEILEHSDVVVEGGIIARIGPGAGKAADNANIIDGSGKLLMPGLINGHCHVPMTLLRNYADDMDLQTWLFEHIFPVEDRMNGDDTYLKPAGIMEMVSTGTTRFADS